MLLMLTLASLAIIPPPTAEDSSLADYFGFESMDVIPIGDGPGPMIVTDLDGDGRTDIVVANNRRSRIEVLRQRSDASPDDPVEQPRNINDFPDHWRFERINIPVSDEIAAMAAADLDQDGRTDLLLGGPPGRVTFLSQMEDGSFSTKGRRDIRKLAASPASFVIADMAGTGHAALVSIVEGEPAIWPLDGFSLGSAKRYPAGTSMIAVVPADYDGDGLMDLAGICPDDPAPVRIWFGRRTPTGVEPGPQTVFEMPPLIEFESMASPEDDATRIAVIERNARRVVLYDLTDEAVTTTADRDAAFTVHGFPDPGKRDRAWTVSNRDGMSELVSADTRSNAITVYRETEHGGIGEAANAPSLSAIDGLASVPGRAGELLVLSTKEGVVGRTNIAHHPIAFPTPIDVSSGHEPVAMNAVEIGSTPHAAIVAANKRDYVLDLVDLDTGTSRSFELGSLSRKPDHVEAIDVDQDGREDLIILTRERPMILLLATDDGFEVLEKRDMSQYGLVDAAGGDNIAALDVTGDGHEELLIADGNFVRAVRFHPTDEGGGWRVERQFNADDPDSDLVAVTSLGGRLVAADREGDRLLVFAPTGDEGDWTQVETMRLRGLTPGPLASGTFSSGGQDIITIGEDGFAVVPLKGSRRTLVEVGSWKSGIEGHIPHELAVGDVNADGYGDMVALDAGEQMMELFTFDGEGDMLHATGFQIYESNLFHGGESREYQPRQIAIADVTGDGGHDIVMLIHDRIIVYQQGGSVAIAE